MKRSPVLWSAAALWVWSGLCSGAPAKGIVRGIYCHPGAAVDNRVWAPYGKGYELDSGVSHAGGSSMRCSNTDVVEAHGGWQSVTFNQEHPRPFVVAGWAKLEGVTGGQTYRCSVYLDLVLKGGRNWPMKIAAFDPAKSGWQYSEQVYEPPAPLASARVHVFLRQAQGTAWFDDIYVGEILDEEGTRSENLLKDPGFDEGRKRDNAEREALFGKLTELGCNAFHFYRSVPWGMVMSEDKLPGPDPENMLGDFVTDAHRHGLGVWLTTGAGHPTIRDAQSPEFPFYPCVNGRWGEAYTRAVAYMTQYGFDGIGVVPDEWTYTTGRTKRSYAKHADPAVVKFYADLPSFCDCPVCRESFEEKYGTPLPDLSKPWSTADPVWARYAQFRYDSTSRWMRRTVEAAKRVNPDVVTDTMICVLPVCSDDRLGAGAAWDKIGVDTALDCLQTDPYIFLHNYLGDSTHYYATETAIHLSAANWQRSSGVTLEACRLREKYRRKDPAEVYGAALSCLVHGAREFFWWHMNYLLGRSDHVAPEVPFKRVRAAYRVMAEMEDAVLGASVPGDLLVLYSRGSEDTWDRLGKRGNLPAVFGEAPNPKRGFIAHRNVLYFLLRRGYPFRMTYLDNPDPARLAAARILLVPFPFSLTAAEVDLVRLQAEAGKTVVLFSELSPLDEDGTLLRRPRLAELFSDGVPDRDVRAPVSARVGSGRVVFLGGDAAVGLLQPLGPVKDPKARVPAPTADPDAAQRLGPILSSGLGHPGTAFLAQPERDVEVAVLDGPRGRVVMAINWDATQPVAVLLRPETVLGGTRARGLAIRRDASVAERESDVGQDAWQLSLQPQEAVLLLAQ